MVFLSTLYLPTFGRKAPGARLTMSCIQAVDWQMRECGWGLCRTVQPVRNGHGLVHIRIDVSSTMIEAYNVDLNPKK